MAKQRPTARHRESFVDRRIREAYERGEFDGLPGAGKPIRDLSEPRDPEWWIRRKVRDENLTTLPPALQLRRDVEAARRSIVAARSEREVRQIVATINAHIRQVNRTIVHGPPSTVMTLDEDAIVLAWHRSRRGTGG